MREFLIRLLGGYTEKGLITVDPAKMTSSTVNRNFTNIVVEIKAGELDIKVSAWDEKMVTNIMNGVFENIKKIPKEDNNPLID